MAKKNKDHLKFTLFPFVSILLAVTGVLLFLTMLQAILMRADENKPEKEKKEKQEEQNTRVYERIPNLKTSALIFTKSGYQILKSSGEKNDYRIDDIMSVVTYINQLLKTNVSHVENEESEREHLLFVVAKEGEQNYFSFFEKIKLNSTIKSYLPTGLVLLNPNEAFKLK